jgi:hypothetical protein
MPAIGVSKRSGAVVRAIMDTVFLAKGISSDLGAKVRGLLSTLHRMPLWAVSTTMA